jgi:acetyl-CoA synthetase
VSRSDEIKGEAIVAFVTLRAGQNPTAELKSHLGDHVAKIIGTIARPSEVRFADLLPKTRSGKIMRRLLRELAQKGGITGDTTTLEDMSSLERLAQQKGQEE